MVKRDRSNEIRQSCSLSCWERCWWKSALLRRQIDECISAISVNDDDIYVQCCGRRGCCRQLASLWHRMSQRRNCVPVPGRYLIHGNSGQHLQPDCRARQLYPFDSFAEQHVGLSTTQPVDEKRIWRLSFISFYRVIHRWLRTRTIPLQPNFGTGSYIRSYVDLFSATGKQAQDEGNELSRDYFGKGYTFFGFDLTPTVSTVAVSIWKERVISASRCTLEPHWNRPWT